jgi:homogentisate 1,2-dioxygenase
MLSGQYWFYHRNGKSEVMHYERGDHIAGCQVTACGESDGMTLDDMEKHGWIMGEPAVPTDEQTDHLTTTQMTQE